LEEKMEAQGTGGSSRSVDRRSRVLAAVLLVAATSPAAAQKATVRDSAGITIVENARVAVPPTAFTLSPRPALQIASRDDDPSYTFSPNVAAVARLSDGRIVVGDAWSYTVRIFGKDGRHATTFGGKGTEPGQLGPINRIFVLPGDTIAVVDGRIVLFSSRGAYIRTESMGARGLTPLARLSSGDWLARRGTGVDSVRVMRVMRTATGASPTDTGMRLAVFDPRDSTLQGAGAHVQNVTVGTRPFLPSAIITALPDGFLMGDGRTFEIAEYSANGRLRRIIRRDVDLRFTQEDAANYRDGEMAGRTGEALDAVKLRLETVIFPKTMPAFQRILVDPAGRIWAQDHIRAPHIPLQWTVFDRDGRMLGIVRVPVGFRVFEIGRDYMLGRLRDANGTAYIQLYTLIPHRN
jgi:hypothetical protein